MSSYHQILIERNERVRKEYEETRSQLRKACQEHNISKIEIEFDGYGDSGTVTITGEYDPPSSPPQRTTHVPFWSSTTRGGRSTREA